MEKNFIMTAFGKDRPGIAADITGVIYESGCNLKDSVMTRLADEFTLILLFSGQGDTLETDLTRECRRLEIEKGLSAFIRPVTSPEWAPPAGQRRMIQVEGLDQAGIVSRRVACCSIRARTSSGSSVCPRCRALTNEKFRAF